MNRSAPLMVALVGALTCAALLRVEIYAYWSENATQVFSHAFTDARYEPPLVLDSGGSAPPDPSRARGQSLHSIIQEAAHLHGLDNACCTRLSSSSRDTTRARYRGRGPWG